MSDLLIEMWARRRDNLIKSGAGILFTFQWQVDKLSQDLHCRPGFSSVLPLSFDSYEIHPDVINIISYSNEIYKLLKRHQWTSQTFCTVVM